MHYVYRVTALANMFMLFSACLPARASSEADEAAFYQGKTVYLVIGSAPGGGFDTYGRLVARYIGKYIPGRPTVVPQNLDGAGGGVAADKVAVTAPQDGTYIGAIRATTILDPLIGDIKRKGKHNEFDFLGSADKDLEGCFLRTDAPVKTFQGAFKTKLLLGASNSGSTTQEFASVLKNVLGIKMDLVQGYTGNSDIMLAMDRGEVQGICGASVSAVPALRPNWFRDNTVRILAQESINGSPQFNGKGIPKTIDFAQTDEQRQILRLFYSQEEFGRPFIVGNKVPKDRVKILQNAFMKTVSDPDLISEANRMGLDLFPLSGEQVSTLVSQVFSSSAEVLQKTRAAIGN
jgi:tripartite-type tricarboxylate transporter receptor subunit TctC